ncbi:MAG: hypothetical protein M3235_13435, partial [Actinomycetota bacterium]|nr:hypothetical protein [Actinomycetota bacterium]
MNLVVPLSQLDRTATATAGGKGANLGELVRAGLPVPDGFVVTTAGYTAAVAGLELPVARPSGAGADGASLRERVAA